MDIPYGFDCFAFQQQEIKYFAPNLNSVRRSVLMPPTLRDWAAAADQADTTSGRADFIKFTRKNEDYPKEQILALGRANRLNMSEIDKRLFCGIKIQIGIGVVTNFLRKGLQYKSPIKGRSELLKNGSWTGIMKGLTIGSNQPESYDLALGNFLAWDEEFPYIKFGPFFAVESKLVFLTGSSRRIEASSFGTNITREIWITILSLLVVLSLLASVHIRWQHQKRKLNTRQAKSNTDNEPTAGDVTTTTTSQLQVFASFFFIYFTMLLSKPSHEFDELIWPKGAAGHRRKSAELRRPLATATAKATFATYAAADDLASQASAGPPTKTTTHRVRLPVSIRALSYVWSAACLVLASIYSGEMLAVMLLHTDQNIDTIGQLINSKPPIEPVIRQDDFTHNLMLKSLDQNMLKLYNMTRTIPRAEVYTRQFIESVSERKVALLGDDELIETIYDLYHKYYPLYKSKVSYLQFPISIMYRKDLNSTLELKLRRGIVQIFEMGLIHRWYGAQKDTYIKFYDTYERNKTNDKSLDSFGPTNKEQKYKPLSMHHFVSFFRAMLYCSLFALLVLLIEIVYARLVSAAGLGRPARATRHHREPDAKPSPAPASVQRAR
jgi:hypothetical protein